MSMKLCHKILKLKESNKPVRSHTGERNCLASSYKVETPRGETSKNKESNSKRYSNQALRAIGRKRVPKTASDIALSALQTNWSHGKIQSLTITKRIALQT